jgi:hypothetical protein
VVAGRALLFVSPEASQLLISSTFFEELSRSIYDRRHLSLAFDRISGLIDLNSPYEAPLAFIDPTRMVTESLVHDLDPG